MQILVILLIQVLFCVGFTIGYGFWLADVTATQAVFSVGTFTDINVPLTAFLNFFTLMIISQNLIPIAMYASVEIVKLVQVSRRTTRFRVR